MLARTTMATDDMNVVQALKKCMSVLESDSTTDEQKSVYLCWLIHLVGDIHQPMHSTAMFSRVTFPEGDRGGNDIPLRRGRNLHSLWDGLLGYDDELPAVRRTALQLLSDDGIRATDERAVDSLDFDDWLDESHRLARDVAYHEKILAAVRAVDQSSDGLGKIELPDAYYSSEGVAAKKRIVEAGYRLGGVLDGLIE